jgi:3-hydroxyacyl-[acyl-carrier-protein] dehydratase
VNESLEARFAVAPDHPSLEGHFPGDPIVPGVVILDEVAGLLAHMRPECRIVAVTQVKFLSILRPDEICEIRFSPGKADSLKFECHAGERLIATGALIMDPEHRA